MKNPSDNMVIASAFRAANDADVLGVMSIQSSKNLNDLNQLHYYVVSSSWMRKAWPLLSGKVIGDEEDVLREKIGRIETDDLLERENPISDEDEDEGLNRQKEQKNLVLHELQKRSDYRNKAVDSREQRFDKLHQHHQRKAELRTDISYGKDFFLLGPNVWTLVQSKFGYDQEIKRKCIFVENQDGTSLAVVLHEADSLTGRLAFHQPIPPTGRFEDEKFLDATDAQGGGGNRHPGNVSDDDDDLFPGLDNMEPDDATGSVDQQHGSESVLLLPASTTPTSNGSHYSWLNGDSVDKGAEVVETRAVMRRYGSGLGNLGNTCFMNSTLQCLAHTDPLRKYFLSGDYERDLNRDNPLGTGGDLATQFAQLLAEMWRTTTVPSSGLYSTYSSAGYSSDPHSSTHVVYPRNFKITLGKHAEQFMGYDQHDSQELATYLLDALHEDTNRVSKKPYVEKPEQGENETDEEAAFKAWALHLKRDDSHVLEYFMGQVKSRVQCCEEGCGRVSTTFDPFMFLSVPIPGSSERTLSVTFVPLDPMQRAKSFSIKINKLASMGDLVTKVQEKVEKSNLTGRGYSVPIEDLAVCDVWKKDIHSWYALDKDVEDVRDSDETFIYELAPLAQIRQQEESHAAQAREQIDASSLGLRLAAPRLRRYRLDVEDLKRINTGTQWNTELERYIRSPHSWYYAFNPKTGSSDERVSKYRKLITFIDLCFNEAEADIDTSGQKRSRDAEEKEVVVHPEDPPVRGIEDRLYTNLTFQNVKSLYDVVLLNFLSKKVRNEILRLEKEESDAFPDGVTIEIRMRKSESFPSRDQNLASPLALRIPSSMTVYGLREELSRRLARSLRPEQQSFRSSFTGETSSEMDVVPVALPQHEVDDHRFCSDELLCLRQIPLLYNRATGSSFRTYSPGQQLGSLQKPGTFDDTKPISLASSTDEAEKMSVAELVGEKGTVFLDWPAELADRYFDFSEFESVDDLDASAGDAGTTRRSLNATTVLDCIEKYCQMEQLEESEMWYCNRCKEHVRAWKQFHIYRSPPILLIHLKRFQYSARTHRRDKINLFIDFPLKNLDLTNHVLHWTEDEKPIYDCYAVSNHYGGLGGGHYTAYALNDDGEWCYYDDSRITTGVDPKEVVSEAAYVLYYRRRDVPVGEEFVMNLQTPGMPAPALIQADKGRDNEASEVSSNAAMVGDEMDIDDADDVASRSTSPMGSVDDGDAIYGENTYITSSTDDGLDGFPPLQ